MKQSIRTQADAACLQIPINNSSMQSKVFVFIALIMAILFLGTLSAEAASIYCVRAGATGANNGSDWNNAYTALPATLVRGASYYIANGSYSGYTFNTATSGSTYITIKKATSSDHGTDTGWSSTYGDGQAVFTSGIEFQTAYWVFDGAIGSGSSTSSYGFYFNATFGWALSLYGNTTIRPVVYGYYGVPANNIQIKHTAVTCPGSSGDIQQFGFSGYGNSVTLTSIYVNNCQVSAWNQGDDSVIENSYFGNHWSSSANHGVQVEQILRPIFRNNYVTMCAPQCIEPGGGTTTNINNGQYYNNVFLNCSGTNGIIKGVSSGGIYNTLIYGNTVVNNAGPLLYQNNEGLGGASGNVGVNNLIYNSNPDVWHQSTGGAISHSYNDYIDSGSTSETGGQIASGNPFVNSANGNYHLMAATNKGLTLSSPYNTDITGATRGADGVWDRGAYEFGGNSSLLIPSAPVLHY